MHYGEQINLQTLAFQVSSKPTSLQLQEGKTSTFQVSSKPHTRNFENLEGFGPTFCRPGRPHRSIASPAHTSTHRHRSPPPRFYPFLTRLSNSSESHHPHTIPRSPRARHIPTASASPAILHRERDHGLVSRADHGDAHPAGARRVASPHRFPLLLIRPRYRRLASLPAR